MTNPLTTAELFTWLASYPKSGNTFLRLLIQAYRSNGHININDVTASVGDNTSFWFQNVSPLALNKLTFNTRLLLRPAALLNQLNSINTKNRFIKTHQANAVVNGLPHLIPNDLTQRAIYIVRDPRDVVTSLRWHMDTGNGGLTIEQAADKLADPEYCIRNEDDLPQVLLSWSKHVKSWTEETRYPVAVVKYEDLCADTVGELTSILEFCDIDVDPDRVRAAVDACAIERLNKQEKETGFREDGRAKIRRDFFHKGGSRWKKELDPAIAAKIERDHGDVMRRFGYIEESANGGLHESGLRQPISVSG